MGSKGKALGRRPQTAKYPHAQKSAGKGESPALPGRGETLAGGFPLSRFSHRIALPLDLLHLEALEDVARLDVAELLQGDAALVAAGDFLHAVLEALEGSDLTFVDHDAVTHQAHGIGRGDLALLDADTGGDADAG